MSLEDLLVIAIGIFLVIALLAMRWCERNTYVLGVGWAIKRKIYLWCQNKRKNAKRKAASGVRDRKTASANLCGAIVAQKWRKIND